MFVWNVSGFAREEVTDLQLENFLAKISIAENGCWPWIGAKTPKGYGHIKQGRKTVSSHRIAYELWVGTIPDGHELDHTCHTADEACRGGNDCPHRGCMNAEHLEPVSGTENILRGRCPSAVNARKTECVHGHPFNPENTYLTPRGHRMCRICKRAAKKRQLRRRAA